MYFHQEALKKVMVKSDCTIREAMKAINDSTMEMVLIVDENEKLLGIATDGDIRRALLNNIGLDAPIQKVINTKFTTLPESSPKKFITTTMKRRYIRQLPLVDSEGRVVDLVLLKDIWREDAKENKVVLMAGGLGTRLRPLTDDLPKPMLKIGDKPILELIINRFKSYGYRDFIISINYKGDLIENYFQDGSDFDVNIEYVVETKRLGTAGAIRLAREQLSEAPFFVMNCDLLTKVNFDSMIKEHINKANELTIAVKSHEYTVPYGVVNLQNGQITDLKEKPTQNYFVSGGIYCLSSTVIDLIPEGEYCDITELIGQLLEQKRRVGSFLITEYWMDIGTLNDYDRAVKEFPEGQL